VFPDCADRIYQAFVIGDLGSSYGQLGKVTTGTVIGRVGSTGDAGGRIPAHVGDVATVEAVGWKVTVTP
jgi:hypothetical protein